MGVNYGGIWQAPAARARACMTEFWDAAGGKRPSEVKRSLSRNETEIVFLVFGRRSD